MFLSWVGIMLKQIWGHFVQNNTVDVNLPCEVIPCETTISEVDLPYDVIVEILSRLPPKTVILCIMTCKPLLALAMTPSFVDMHLNRAREATTPVIAFHYQPPRTGHCYCHPTNNCKQMVNICFTPHKSDNYTIKTSLVDVCANQCDRETTPLDVAFKCRKRTSCVPYLYGSCNGLLLFKNLYCDSLLLIWNPVLRQQDTVIPTPTGCRVRGFFYHPEADEYRIVFLSMPDGVGVDCFEYYIYGLKTKELRWIQWYSYAPTGDRNPILVNGFLHWKVSEEIHKNVHGVYPDCSNSILLFNIYTEEFATMLHPGRQCGPRSRHRRHGMMQLMENEGHLYFCNSFLLDDIVVWRLEDYRTEVWTKIHVIQEPYKVLSWSQYLLEPNLTIVPLDMHKDEIIIRVNGRFPSLFLYNMSDCSFREIGKQYTESSASVYPFYHVDSLVSLHSNNTNFFGRRNQ